MRNEHKPAIGQSGSEDDIDHESDLNGLAAFFWITIALACLGVIAVIALAINLFF